MRKAACLILAFGLLAGIAPAIPLEVTEPGFTLTLPDGFKEVSSPSPSSDVMRFFVRPPREGESGEGETWLTIRRGASDGAPSLREEGDTNLPRVVRRYSERLDNLDVDVLVSEIRSNDTVAIEQSARLPLDPDTIRLDLKVHSDDDREAKEMMRKILQSVARSPESKPSEDWASLRSALIYLVMVAAVFIVILARR